MDINPFDSFTVRPAANGLIVEPQTEPQMAISSLTTHVFTDFNEFTKWVESRVLLPADYNN